MYENWSIKVCILTYTLNFCDRLTRKKLFILRINGANDIYISEKNKIALWYLKQNQLGG